MLGAASMRTMIAILLLALDIVTQAHARGPYGSIKVAGLVRRRLH